MSTLNTLKFSKELENQAICVTCGTQYDIPLCEARKTCRICADPRQFVPSEGQLWSSYAQERDKHENYFTQDLHDSRIWFINTVPKLGIGQRAIFIQTPHGNILWDLLAWVDSKTIDWITSKGGLSHIVISHPHFYTTHALWSALLPQTPIHTHALDAEWLNHPNPLLTLFTAPQLPLLNGVSALLAGGHFPGSLILHSSHHRAIFVADTLMTVPSAHTPSVYRVPNTPTYAFMWSIPNMQPLSPNAILGIWRALEGLEFSASYGGFTGQNVLDDGLKRRVLESMQGQVRRAGWVEADAEILMVRIRGG